MKEFATGVGPAGTGAILLPRNPRDVSNKRMAILPGNADGWHARLALHVAPAEPAKQRPSTSDHASQRVARVGLDAIEELYARHGAMVLRRARAILGEEQAARDAMQEVFVRAFRERDGFRGEASPVTWLYQITTNLCLNKIRDSARQRELLARQGAPSEEAGEASPEMKATLAAILRRVPDALREIAVYYYVDEMNQDEIAELLGVSRRTVGNRLEEFKAAALAAAGGKARGHG